MIAGANYELGETKEVSTTLLKVVLLAETDIGKSHLMKIFAVPEEDRSITSTGVDVWTKKVQVPNKEYILQCSHSFSKDNLRTIPSWCIGSDIYVLYYDVDVPNSHMTLSTWRNIILQDVNIREADGFPFIVVGHKSDDREKKSCIEAMKTWCRRRSIAYFEIPNDDDVQAIFKTAIVQWETQDANIKCFEKNIELPMKRRVFLYAKPNFSKTDFDGPLMECISTYAFYHDIDILKNFAEFRKKGSSRRYFK